MEPTSATDPMGAEPGGPPPMPSAPSGAARFAGSARPLPVGANVPPPPARHARKGGWGWVIGLILVAGALVGGFAVLGGGGSSAGRRTSTARADGSTPPASKYGPLFESGSEIAGFHWKAPRSQINPQRSTLPGTVFDHKPHDIHTWGNSEQMAFMIAAFPASVGAGDGEEAMANDLMFQDSVTPTGNPVIVAGHEGHEFVGSGSFDGDDGTPVTTEQRLIATSIDGAFILVVVSGAQPAGVDEVELARLLDSIEYDPDVPVHDRATEEGKRPLPDGKLQQVTDATTGFGWRSPKPFVEELLGPLAARRGRAPTTSYRYRVGVEIYDIHVHPPSVGASQADVDGATAYVDGKVIEDTRPITIAGAPGIRLHAVDWSCACRDYQLVAAAAIDGAYIVIEAHRTDDEDISPAEFDRLVASITKG